MSSSPAKWGARTLEAEGGWVVSGFRTRLLIGQAAMALVAYTTLALLVPWALMLEPQVLGQLAAIGVPVALGAVLVTTLLSALRLRASGPVLRSLAFEPEAVAPQDMDLLANLPFSLSARFVATGAVAALLLALPQLRPEQLDDARALSLALLTLTLVSSSAVVHYVVVRESIVQLIELSDPEPTTTWLEQEALRLAPQQRLIRKLLLAVVAPVALVGVGTVLVAHAHLRAFVERSRTATATALVRAALEDGYSGSDEAAAAAQALGFFTRFEQGGPRAETTTVRRLGGGELELAVPTDSGRVVLRYAAELSGEVVTTGALLALLAVAVAAALGRGFGGALAADLTLATQQVSALGTESVLRGEGRVAGRARFRAVGEVGRSVEALTERFRVFAAAQERALSAREAAQRMKQLLFASVSHDLKSPLNAILGFAELVREEPLTHAQAENLEMVAGRGRELLALIETILDAARVEAGQMQLMPQAIAVETLVADTIAKARELDASGSVEVLAEVAPGLPPVWLDSSHAPRALAVLVAHALDSAVSETNRAVRVGATLRTMPGEPPSVRLQITYVAVTNRPSLLEAQLAGRLRDDSGRGMVLRLSLARAIIELHGGRVEVERGPHGAAVVSCWLPLAKRGQLP